MNSYMVIADLGRRKKLREIGEIEFKSGIIGDLYILETNKSIDQVKNIEGVLGVTKC